MEPEKWSLIHELEAVAAAEPEPGVRLILFMRTSLESYPREQQLTYTCGRILSEYLLGRRLDLFFGPCAFRAEMVDCFLRFDGESWDSVHVPKFRAIMAGVPYRQIAIEYAHPHEQTVVESGDLVMFLKRTRQAHELSEAYICEFERHRKGVDQQRHV
jgi:hypothetical protein